MTSTIQRKINKPIHLFIGTLIIVLISVFGTPLFVNAQTAVTPGTPEFSTSTPINSTYTLLEPLPCITGVTNCAAGATSTPAVNIQTYIVYIFELMIALAVLAAVVMCIVGGFEYMLTESVTTKLNAKATIENAILGLAGALGSWLILYTINPNLVNVSIVTVPKLNVSTTNINLDNLNALVTASNNIVSANDAVQEKAQSDQETAAEDAALLYGDDCTDANDNLVSNTPACQEAYNQWVTDQATAASSTSAAIISQAQSAFAADAIVNQTGGKLATSIQQVQQQDLATYNQSMAQLKANNDIPGEQTLTQAFNLASTSLQNQAVIANEENGTYYNQASANKALTAATAAINANTTAATANITNQTLKQQYIDNANAQITAMNAHPWQQNLSGTLFSQ
jgi:hypothetical protein